MTYPNERDCEHGQLRRSCNICEYEKEIKDLTEKLRLADMLKCSNCGYEWRKGQDGRHSCNTYLLQRISVLENGLKELISVAEDCDGWDHSLQVRYITLTKR